MKNKKTLYNSIGTTYDVTRKSDPTIVSILKQHLNCSAKDRVLDIGCGSGNYTIALHKAGVNIEGIDISEAMLESAKSKCSSVKWYNGDVCYLPFEKEVFNGAIFILVTHHICHLLPAFQEAFRVINKGRCVIMTATPEQMKGYWLWEYFPMMMQSGSNLMKSYEELSTLLRESGFSNITQDKFFITNELQDLFLASGKYQPEIYLDSAVRNGISSFHISSNTKEIHSGLAKLKLDIESGIINEVITKYESDAGEYSFIIAEK